jgi:16S rRNA (uracil1498-N3)-methyltransferase
VTTTFYAPPNAFAGDRVTLPDDEARHAVKVLRMAPGDPIVVVDGVGGWHEGAVVEAGRTLVARVERTRCDVGERAVGLWLAISPLAKRDRLEFATEKATELGVTDLVLVRSARTPPGNVKTDRIASRLVASVKQSLRCRLPTLHESNLSDLPHLQPDVQWVMLHEEASQPLPAAIAGAAARRPLGLIVGPEGGFDPSEVEAMQGRGVGLALLGPRRLRAETAAVAAVALASALHA